MRQRERQHEEPRAQQPTAPSGQESDLREQAERLLVQGADAIDRALSGDSAAFLAANRQEGGQ